ncbi:MAG TPA: hypothetical protein VIO58_01980 [Candidatus Methanoperedens sp.]
MRPFLKILLFLLPVYLPILFIGGIFGLAGVVAGIIVSLMVCLLIVFNVERLVLRIYKAKPALPADLSDIREKVRILSVRKDVKVPSIYISELPLPGSFVIGNNPGKTALIMPKRLLSILKNEELEAVLAYNIVQIDNGIRLRTLAALIAGILTKAASAIRWGAVFTGFGDYDDPAPKLFGFFIMGLTAPPAATMIDSVSKQDYDAEVVSLYMNPAALILAIERLEDNNVTAYPSLGFLCLVDPLKENFFESLFNAHAPKDIRIKNLAGIKA